MNCTLYYDYILNMCLCIEYEKLYLVYNTTSNFLV